MKEQFKAAELAIINELRVDDQGNLWWIKQNKMNNRNMDKPVGSDSHGYLQVTFMYNGHQYNIKAHHIVWRLSTGGWPIDQLDHIDRNRSNNSIKNLHEVTNQKNQMNTGVQKNNKLGYQNITMNGKGYLVQVKLHGKLITMKTFKSLDQAITYRDQIRSEYGFTPASDDPKVAA